MSDWHETARARAITGICNRCNGRGVIETGTISKGPGGYGYDTISCGCEERSAFREAAEEAGWYIESVDDDGIEVTTAWAKPDTYNFGPPIAREEVPAGAVYEHGHAPGKLWLNDEPHLMEPDNSIFRTWFRVATLKEPCS